MKNIRNVLIVLSGIALHSCMDSGNNKLFTTGKWHITAVSKNMKDIGWYYS